jgi:hypothetical protein
MGRMRSVRRLLSVLAMLMLLGVGAAVNAAPAAAAIGVPFGSSDGTVWGYVNFYNGYSVSVEGSVYGLSTNPGYLAHAVYYEGNARINCRQTPTRSNRVDGTVRNYYDSMACLNSNGTVRANIQQVAVNYYNNGYRYTQYIWNPWL